MTDDVYPASKQDINDHGPKMKTNMTFQFRAAKLLTVIASALILLGAPSAQGFNTITAKTSLAVSRAFHASAAANGKIYVFGGYNINGGSTNVSTVERYNPSVNTWTSITGSGCAARVYGVAATVNGSIYLWGGSNYASGAGLLEKFDTTTQTCSALTPTGASFTAHEASAAAVFDGKIYVSGGFQTSPASTLYVYDPAANTWTQKASMNYARYGHGSAVANGKIYVFGGSSNVAFPNGAVPLSSGQTVEAYDPSTNTWAVVNDSGFTPRVYLGAATWCGVMYMFGGATYSSGLVVDDTIEGYDALTGAWKSLIVPSVPVLTQARFGVSATELLGKIYAIGGANTTGTYDVNDQYDSASLDYGSISANISPYLAVEDGAKWRCTGGGICDGNHIFGSGDVAAVSDTVSYTVTFDTIGASDSPKASGDIWATPASVSIGSLQQNVITLVNAMYSAYGAFTAKIFPILARESGRWSVDGGTNWHLNDTITGLQAGAVTLSFKSITGWVKPSSTSVTISGGHLTSSAGTYKSSASDVNGDGYSDVIWQNSATGDGTVWLMSDGVVTSTHTITSPTGGQYDLVSASSDFNGDGKADMLWREKSTGSLYMRLMNGDRVWDEGYVTNNSNGKTPAPGDEWRIAGIGDFNGDGMADILWRDSKTGALVQWTMDGKLIITGTSLGTVKTEWDVSGTGDFNADGTDDILWRNGSNGSLVIWNMMDGKYSSYNKLGALNSSWRVEGLGDFDGDGRADILLRDKATGAGVIWLIDNGAIKSSASIGVVDARWEAAAIGDYNGDGKGDILWRDSSSGQVTIWLMDGGKKTSSTTLGGATEQQSAVNLKKLQ